MKFILTADWHLRNTKPRCRLDDDWDKTQIKMLMQIEFIAKKRNCDVYVVGDIFHSNSDTSFKNIQMVQSFAKNLADNDLRMYLLAGNHDLPYHSSENIDKSAIGILLQSENISLIPVTDKVSATNFDIESQNKEIIFKHVLCFPDDKSIPPNVNAITAKELLGQYDKAKWIFTGDYHHNFHFKANGCHVVNSGCLIRQVSDMKDYVCGVYYVDTDNEIVEFIQLKDDVSMVDDTYILKQNEKEERIEEFITKLTDTQSVSLDFLDNVEKALLENDLDESLKACIKEFINDY